MCLKLLSENDDVRKIYKDKYDEILIDEYQDSNLIQEYIINTISNQKTFLFFFCLFMISKINLIHTRINRTKLIIWDVDNPL